MGVYLSFRQFVQDHLGCGTDSVSVGALTPPAPDGYRLGALCVCGSRFDRWVSAADAREDLLYTDLLTRPN